MPPPPSLLFPPKYAQQFIWERERESGVVKLTQEESVARSSVLLNVDPRRRAGGRDQEAAASRSCVMERGRLNR